MLQQDVRVRELYWDDANVDHLWESHQVTPDEVRDVLLGVPGEDPFYTVRRDGTALVFAGRAGNGRLLKMAGEDMGGGIVRIFSCDGHECAASSPFSRDRTMTMNDEDRGVMVRRLEDENYDVFENALVARGTETRPVAFRAAEPLVDALDSLAAKERKSRASLIQDILWEYVRSVVSIRELISRYPLGTLELRVLGSLVALGNSGTAVEVRRWLRDQLDDKSRLPSILVILAQLLERGYITGAESGGTDVTYSVAPAGQAAYVKMSALLKAKSTERSRPA